MRGICFQVFAATDTEASVVPYVSLGAHRWMFFSSLSVELFGSRVWAFSFLWDISKDFRQPTTGYESL